MVFFNLFIKTPIQNTPGVDWTLPHNFSLRVLSPNNTAIVYLSCHEAFGSTSFRGCSFVLGEKRLGDQLLVQGVNLTIPTTLTFADHKNRKLSLRSPLTATNIVKNCKYKFFVSFHCEMFTIWIPIMTAAYQNIFNYLTYHPRLSLSSHVKIFWSK